MWTALDMNTRETATLVWAAVLIVFVLANRDLRHSAVSVVRALAQHPIRIVVGSTTCVAVLIVAALASIGYWRPTMIYETLIWFAGTGVAGTFNSDTLADLWGLLIKTVALTSVIEFLTNAYTFAMPIELTLVPVVYFLLASMSLAQSRPEFAQVRRPLAFLITVVIVAAIAPTVVHLLNNPGEVLSAVHVKAFLLPLILTVCFLPYMYAARMIVVWQTMLAMLRDGMKDQPGLYDYAKRAVIRGCGASLVRAQLFEPEYRWRLAAATSRDDVVQVLGDFRTAAADRPWKRHPQREPSRGHGWREVVLPTADASGVLANSVALADQVQTALNKAAASTGDPSEALRALLDRTGEQGEFGAVSLPERAEMIQLLAEQHRSIAEIESMAPAIAMLATMHNAEVRWLTKRFDQILRLAGEPAANARGVAGILHGTSANTRATFAETIDAMIIAYGGNIADERDAAEAVA